MSVSLSPALTFREAFDSWLSNRILQNQGAWTNARFISNRTEKDLKQYAAQVELFIGAKPLGEIHAGHLREYQRARAVCDKAAAAWKQRAGANLIRKEVGLLVRIMKVAGAWSQELEENHVKVKSVQNDTPQALSPEEQHCWLHTAGSRLAWRVVYWYSIAGFQTSASTNELRALRLHDVDLSSGIISVRNEGAKNKYRIRSIPIMTPELAAALAGLIERAKDLGAAEPFHYLFPRHKGFGEYDPLRPMSVWGLRKPWDEVRSATGLTRFTPYDTRHTALTRMAEAGVPIAVAMSFAGHMSPRMQQWYISVSMASKRTAAALAFAGMNWNGAAPEKKPPLPVTWGSVARAWR